MTHDHSQMPHTTTPVIILLALGSNTQYSTTMPRAQESLSARFKDIRFTRTIVSADVKNPDAAPYANCLCLAQTTMDREEVTRALHEIESACGNSRELRAKGQVLMDIDLLRYDDEILHAADWQRTYIKTLLSEL